MYQQNMAFLLIDVINDFQFEDGDKLLEQALPVAENIAALKERAIKHQIPIIYVNDHFKNWQGDFFELVDRCLNNEMRGKKFVEWLKPNKGEYHILKPSYSGFYATPLPLLLEHLNVQSLIITGLAGNMCVQFTANDAFMRGFKLYIPKDCIASNTEAANVAALTQMNDILGADISPSHLLKLHQYSAD